jgi:hypothetical protein
MRQLIPALIALPLIASAGGTAAETLSYCNGREYRTQHGVSVPCSHTWALHGFCNSREMVHAWKVDGNEPGDHYLWPWFDEKVNVIGYEMLAITEGKINFFMIGSGHQPDAFLWMGRGEHRVRNDFRPGYVHPWMGRAEAQELRKYGHQNMIDVHGSCTSRDEKIMLDPVTLYVTVYYVSPPVIRNDKASPPFLSPSAVSSPSRQ